MTMRRSIFACRQALLIMRGEPGGGIPLTVDGEERVVTEVFVRDGHWYSGDRRLSRSQQEALTRRAQAIIEEDRRRYEERFPRQPPRVSIRECREAIRMGGGIRMRLRGEERVIREIRTGGAGNPRWFTGGLRLTVREQARLTELARALIARHRKGE